MPVASAGPVAPVKYAWMDHDTPVFSVSPPIQNQWYTVFQDQDVRLTWCSIAQISTPAAAKDIQVRWTLDGNVYRTQASVPSGVDRFVYRSRGPSTAGTAGLLITDQEWNSIKYVDKRGQNFKVEVRMTSAPAAAQSLICTPVYETLEVT